MSHDLLFCSHALHSLHTSLNIPICIRLPQYTVSTVTHFHHTLSYPN